VSKPLNVYDSVNRNRLLGTHPRWAGLVGDHCHYAVCRSVSVYNSCSIPEKVETQLVDLQRVVITSKDGWEAEVALVTYSPLKDLMILREFRLPGEDDYGYARRREACGYY
jgi:hypothetical protein